MKAAPRISDWTTGTKDVDRISDWTIGPKAIPRISDQDTARLLLTEDVC